MSLTSKCIRAFYGDSLRTCGLGNVRMSSHDQFAVHIRRSMLDMDSLSSSHPTLLHLLRKWKINKYISEVGNTLCMSMSVFSFIIYNLMFVWNWKKFTSENLLVSFYLFSPLHKYTPQITNQGDVLFKRLHPVCLWPYKVSVYLSTVTIRTQSKLCVYSRETLRWWSADFCRHKSKFCTAQICTVYELLFL